MHSKTQTTRLTKIDQECQKKISNNSSIIGTSWICAHEQKVREFIPLSSEYELISVTLIYSSELIELFHYIRFVTIHGSAMRQ